LFPQQAAFSVDSDGLARLLLPTPVLSACRPDLSDLRVFDAQGGEVAYLLDGERGPDVSVEARTEVSAQVLRVTRESSGAEFEPPVHREVYEIAAPPRSNSMNLGLEPRWTLVVNTATPRFVREVSIEARSADGTAELLASSEAIFSLDGEVHRTRIPLPPFRGERVVVSVTGQEGAYLEPTFRFETARSVRPLREAVVGLELVDRHEDAGTTLLELRRPGAIVPDVLRVSTRTGSYRRRVTVWDVQPGEPDVELGSAVLYRVELGAGEQRVFEQRSVRLLPARGSQLRVEIENGDSPALAEASAEAIVRRPALVFQLPAGQHRGVLRFGGARAHRVAYDLSGLLLGPSGRRSGESARAAFGLYDPDALARVRLSEIQANPDFDTAPALAFAMQPGATIDVRLYEHARSLVIDPSAEGLSRLVLAPEDMARARADLADVRVVDADGRQWPYLIEHGGPSREIPLAIRATPPEDGRSRYHLELPTAPLAIDHIRLDLDAPYVHRSFVLSGVDVDGETAELARGEIVKDARRPRPFGLGLRRTRVRGFELSVEDGDDAPLRIERAVASTRLSQVFLVAPAGGYALLIGQPADVAPRYELERVRDVVLAVASHAVMTGDLGANPAFSATARIGPESIRFQQWAVWGVLLVTAAALLLLTLRVARRSPEIPG
jgi:hypothetical protein